jgi:hypothetical protein
LYICLHNKTTRVQGVALFQPVQPQMNLDELPSSGGAAEK